VKECEKRCRVHKVNEMTVYRTRIARCFVHTIAPTGFLATET
jgi:hypothetical protein